MGSLLDAACRRHLQRGLLACLAVANLLVAALAALSLRQGARHHGVALADYLAGWPEEVLPTLALLAAFVLLSLCAWRLLRRLMCRVEHELASLQAGSDALRDSESLLRTLISEIPDPVCLKDAEGNFLFGNRALAKLYDTTPEELVGKQDGDFGVPPEIADAFRENVLAIMARGEAEVVFEDTLNAATGEIQHFRSIKHPFKDAQGRMQVLIIAQDISLVVREQEKVAESERRLQDVLRVTREAIWDWHLPSGKVVHNRRWYEILGLDDKGEIGSFAEFAARIHPDDRPAVRQRVDAVLKGECESYQSEHRMLGRDGSVWVHDRGGVVERDADGNPVRMVGSFIDISARREADARIASLLEEQQAILQSEVVGFVMLRRRRMVWMNHAFARMLDYRQEDLVDQPTQLLHVSDEDWRAFGNAALPVIAAGGVFRQQKQFLRKDGSAGWYDVFGARLHAGGEESIWAFVDISAQKRTEAELIEAQQKAQQASVAKSRFLATVSHEIRTPMNGILGMAQVLLLPGISDEERGRCARTILNSGEMLLALLNDILDLSKVEEDRIELEAMVFAPAQIIQEIHALFGESAIAKGLRIESASQVAAGRRYRGDTVRLRQMLGNLVNNAIKFTERGEVRITAREVSCAGGDAVLEFAVADTGIGIPADKQPLMFEPFSQIDSSTTRQYGGTGLGLSIVRRLAELMGGEAGVDSAPGQGSRFWFRIRVEVLAEGDELGREGDPKMQRKCGEGAQRLSGRVLVVEDNAVNRQVIKLMLTKSGIEVREAENGRQGVDSLLYGETPDLVFMDVQMPVLDGYAATRAIRQWEAESGRPPVPIIALTADAFEKDRQDCLAAGMDDFLCKPIEIGKLSAMLEKWLPRRAAEGQAPAPEPAGSVFDAATMLELLGGDHELARSVVEMALDDLPGLFGTLAAALDAGQREQATRAAHTMKGMIAQIGGTSLSGLMKDVEQMLKSGGEVDPASVAELRRQYEILSAALREWRARGSG
ncbi:PAS domain S-box protein [Rhodocyclus purpureus]|uniref:PAS domain S-box protein n=1 Tax=Rhodocyclus purpureus TaxID=1067 RepID=UPI001913EC52